MQEMGIADQGLAVRALQIMGGDLQVSDLSVPALPVTGCGGPHLLWVGGRGRGHAVNRRIALATMVLVVWPHYYGVDCRVKINVSVHLTVA